MAREPKCRRVQYSPKVTVFNPSGIPTDSLEEIALKLEELEAIRLKDLLGLEQEECAERMGVSRPTFQRILIESRAKIAGALINGKIIRIEGGDYCLGQGPCRRSQRLGKRSKECPFCNDIFEDEGTPNLGRASVGSKIAICANSNSPSALVDGRFGRCAYFMIWDDQKAAFDAISNAPQVNQQAGIGAVQELLQCGVGILVCNRIGPKAFALFKKAGGKVYCADEGLNIEYILKCFHLGELHLLENANNM